MKSHFVDIFFVILQTDMVMARIITCRASEREASANLAQYPLL